MDTTPEQRRLTVHRIVREQLGMTGGDAIHDSDKIVSDLGGDSLDIVETVMALEDEFYIEIPDSDLDVIDNTLTVGRLVEEVEKRAVAA